MPHPVIGITGRIGSGKSTAVEFIKRNFDVNHIDLDQIGHALLNREDIQAHLVNVFGERIRQDKTVHRPTLAQIVFNDEKALKQLNAIMHPEIFIETQVLTRKYSMQKASIIDGALIFEVKINTLCNKTICITANDENIQKAIGEERFKRAKFQLETASLKDRCDIHITNPYTDDFYLELTQIMSRLINT